MGSFRSFKLGLTAAGLALYCATSMLESHAVITDHHRTPAFQKVSLSCTDVTEPLATPTLHCCVHNGSDNQPVTSAHLEPEREENATTQDAKQDSGAGCAASRDEGISSLISYDPLQPSPTMTLGQPELLSLNK
ncbi:hypothetical protein BU25DRAFT_425256 [Macroventuria anomochaeta]|uniref:Uncharacterized protein n=1 Tax=Macroventuria anomochaeta TaxID=301207 RepID=A0ACB6RLV5_9PLEO|nr:uncharacterized protein BU25DRAFT_425256 [Macroventuria anomochaeta]KAF2623001.1 hypothetical protein BU25DRAFT_425256 [Macroventuria anomochaeta]